MTKSRLGFYLFAFLLIADGALAQQRRNSKSSSSSVSSSTSASQVVDFDCPEEFGYYPHPADCTQYYVCVFGGALLESCTGGLMYSHELQTCDWPRNVGCGELVPVSTVSTVKSPEPRPRQSSQLRSSQQQQQQQQQRQQQQQPLQQQYAPQRPLQREEAIPKHHLYTEEDLGPAEEVESDRQQRVYRGQPATLGQVARDRDGLSRHSNALQVSPANGREKLSVISFGTQQQYSRQSIAPPPYIEQTTTRVTSRGYNSTQQQYTPSPYDPYYNIYEDDADLYKDIDYSQYSGQQNQQYQAQPTYKEKQPQVVQQQVQATPSRKPSVQYSPPPPQPSFNAVQQDVYSQSVSAQDYNDNYSLQDEDVDYKQSDIDLKGNRSRTTKRQGAAKLKSESEKHGEKQEQPNNPPRNRHLTLTAAFSFDDDKTPVTSSKKLEENVRHRSSLNSFRVEEPPSSGPQRDTHDLVLNYLRQENSAYKVKNNLSDAHTKVNDESETATITNQAQSLPKNYPKPFSHYLSDLETSQISSTSPPKRDTKVFRDDKSQSSRPFRIIVPSTTENSADGTSDISDQVTLKPRYSLRRGNRQQIDVSEISTPESIITIRPYKLPPLSRETLGELPVEEILLKTNQGSENIQDSKKEIQATTRIRQQNNDNSGYQKQAIDLVSELDSDSIKFIPITPQRNPFKSSSENVTSVSIKTTSSPVINSRSQVFSNTKEDANSLTNPTLTPRIYQSQLRQTTTLAPSDESIVRLIPIKAVRSRVQYQANQNEEVLLKNDEPEVTPTTLTINVKDSVYQVTEENSDFADYTPSSFARNRKYKTQLIEKDDKVNLSNTDESTITDDFRKLNIKSGGNGRTSSRFSQATADSSVPASKPLYSLRIDNQNRKYSNQLGGLLLATLETITVPPETNNSNLEENNNSPIPTQVDSKYYPYNSGSIGNPEESNDRMHNENQDEQQNNHANDYSQPRIRTRGKSSVLKNSSSSNKEYSVPSSITSTENYEQVTSSRARIRTKLGQKRPQFGTEYPDTSNLYDSQKETGEREVASSKKSSTENKLNDSFKHLNSNENLNIYDNEQSTVPNYDYKGKQLKSRNRLESVGEEPRTGKLKDVSFDSEEETVFTDNKKVIAESGTTNEGKDKYEDSSAKYEDPWRKTQTWFTTPQITTTDEINEELLSEISKERQHNTRKMHIRKKLRSTTLPPQSNIQSSDFESVTIKSNVAFNSIREEQSNSKHFENLESDEINKRNRLVRPSNKINRLGDLADARRTSLNDRNSEYREIQYQLQDSYYSEPKQRDDPFVRTTTTLPKVDPYSLLQTSLLNDNSNNTRSKTYEQIITTQTPKPLISRNSGVESKLDDMTKSFSPIALEVNSYFKENSQNVTTSSSLDANTRPSTTPYPMTTVERIRDKFRLGSFPKPAPSSNSYGRKPSVEDNTPPPLPSDRCSQELDNESECNEKPLLRVRPTPGSPDSQSTPGLTRGSSRNRGSATYTVSPNEAEPSPPPNRGTPPPPSRNRPTLKPSTAIVSKASEYIDIYRYPPSRPEPIYPTPQVDKTAAKCRKDVCLLPDCSCGGKDIPGDLLPEETPQIVLLTFDDSVNDLNKGLYSDLFEKGRTNPNGCPIAATFYVSHEWTDYSQVQNLYSGGHEIASHSVSHSFGEQFSVKKWTREIAGQREILSAYGGVRQEDIRGMRAPFLAIGGNKMFKMLYDSNFTYDSSMPVYENKPPSWPYTLDYKVFHDCMIPPCPTRSYPGVWEVPMVMWQDLNGGRCSMGDACSNPPTADGVYKMLIKNFERHFTSNRSPFGLFYHAAWFTQPHHKEGFIAFLDTITKMPEVWLVSNWQAIQWVRDPTPISRLNNFAPFQCNYPERPRRCNNPKVCNLWHKSGVRYMRTCQPCPEIYPWTGKSGVRNSRVDNEIITE